MMTKNKAGKPCFVKGKKYKPVAMFTPIWSPMISSTCLDVQDITFGKEDGTTDTIEGGKGLFTVGEDTRWYHASEQFEEA